VTLLLSLLLLVINVMLAWFTPPPEWVSLAVMSNLGSLAVFWRVRGNMATAARLTATSLVVVYLLNYHMQIFLVDWLYHSERFESLWREFSLRRLDGSLESRIDTVYAITAIFALLCSLFTAFGLRAKPGAPASPGPMVQARSGAQTLWVIYGLGVACTAVGLLAQVTLGIGALTAEKAFGGRWDGVLYHGLVTFAPLLFMAIHWEGLRQGHSALSKLSLITYGALAVAEMAMMSSRGFVVLQMLPLVLLYFWMGYSPRKLLTIGLATMLVTVLLYPIITTVRGLRANSGYGAVESIQAAFTSGSDVTNTGTILVRMSARFIGYTSYLTSLERPDDRFDWSYLDGERLLTLRENGFTRWFTERIAGYGTGIQRHFSSPGLLGAAQVLGGPWCVFLVPPLFALLALWSVTALAQGRWRLGPLVPVNTLASLLFLFEEGVFDLIFTRIMLVSFSLIFLNWLFRFAVPDTRHAATAS